MTVRSEVDADSNNVIFQYKAHLVEEAHGLSSKFKNLRDSEIKANQAAKRQGESTVYFAHILIVTEPKEGNGLKIEWCKIHKKTAMTKPFLARINKGKKFLYNLSDLKKGLDMSKPFIWAEIEAAEYSASRIRTAWAEIVEAEACLKRAAKAMDKIHSPPDRRQHKEK